MRDDYYIVAIYEDGEVGISTNRGPTAVEAANAWLKSVSEFHKDKLHRVLVFPGPSCHEFAAKTKTKTVTVVELEFMS